MQLKPYYNVCFHFFCSLSFIFLCCDLKKLLTLSFCWMLSSLPGTTRVFCKKSCYIKLRGLDSLIFPLFISKFELNFLHWSVWFWFGSELHILICFFLHFFWIQWILFCYAFRGLHFVPPPYSRIGLTWIATSLNKRHLFSKKIWHPLSFASFLQHLYPRSAFCYLMCYTLYFDAFFLIYHNPVQCYLLIC